MPSFNPTIALQAQNPDLEPRENALMRALQLQSAQQQLEASRERLSNERSDRAELNALSRVMLDPQYQRNGRFDLDLGTPALYSAAPNKAAGFVKGLQDQQKTAVETGNKQAEMNQHQWRLLGTMARVAAADPRQETVNALFDQWEGLTGQKAGPWRSAFSQAQTPEQIREMALRVDLDAKDQLAKFETRNTGGTTQTLAIDPVNGGARVVSSVQNTQSPDNAATNARFAADNAASRAQAERHFQANQNAPQYMETDAGLVALPRKLQPGQGPVATPVAGPTGERLGKPLRPIPAGVNTAIIGNTQALNQLDRAIALLEGQDVGEQKGDRNATGWKGYAPQGILNRMDKQGVDARAEIADVGSLKIHDRSGAAVTISEFPRLAPFVPLPTDDGDTARKKLRRLRTEVANERAALQQTYSREQGYQPSPVQPAGAQRPTVSNW